MKKASRSLMRDFFVRALRISVLALLATAGVQNLPLCCRGITFQTAPSFAPSANAPLAGTLQLTTDVPSRVSVSVSGSNGTWTRNFYDYATGHSLPLLGFKPDRTNEITVTVYDQRRNAATAPEPLEFITAPLPGDFPTLVVLQSEPAKMEPGYTLFRVLNRTDGRAFIVIVDSAGEVVWYSAITTTSDVRQLANGDLFIPLVTSFVEIDMLGNTVKTWPVPNGLLINVHDGVPTEHGTILYLNDASRVETNFPTSSTYSNAPLQTTSVLYNRVVEISADDSSLLNLWSPIDFLDPRRLTYLTFDLDTPSGWDIEHANALIEDPRDNSLILSLREQNAVIKFSRDGQLKWILGPPANWGPDFQQYLLTPVGEPFEWQFGQHAPTLTPQGTLMVYDDGNYRASPYDPPVADQDNYSRAVEYDINEQTMEVAQVWDYGRTNAPNRLYTDRVGNADYLPKLGNVLVDFGYIIYADGGRPSPAAPSATMLRIQEVTHETLPEVVFDLAAFDYGNTDPNYLGYFAYRAHRIPDLYSVQAQPVQDLAVSVHNDTPELQFSAEPNRTYTIEVSTDLENWESLGAATGDENGNFQFQDQLAGSSPARFYRVLTH